MDLGEKFDSWRAFQDAEARRFYEKPAGSIGVYKNDFSRELFGKNTESWSEPQTMHTIRRLWPVVSGNLAKHTLPIKLSSGRLTVRAEKSIYSQELSFFAPEIIKQLKAGGIEVNKVAVDIGPINWQEIPSSEKSHGPITVTEHSPPEKLSEEDQKLIERLRAFAQKLPV